MPAEKGPDESARRFCLPKWFSGLRKSIRARRRAGTFSDGGRKNPWGFLYGNQSAKKQRRKMGRGAFKRRAGKEGHFRLNVCCHLKT
nr:hypothetical protein [Bacillaceae bacterium]